MKYANDAERDLHQSVIDLVNSLPEITRACIKKYIQEACTGWSRADADFVIMDYQRLAELRNELIYLMGAYIEVKSVNHE